MEGETASWKKAAGAATQRPKRHSADALSAAAQSFVAVQGVRSVLDAFVPDAKKASAARVSASAGEGAMA
jgi:hypothetical protein